MKVNLFAIACSGFLLASLPESIAFGQPPQLSNTLPLDTKGDIASDLVDGVDRFLLKQLDESVKQRIANWPKPAAQRPDRFLYEQEIANKRTRLREMIGMVDARLSPEAFHIDQPANLKALDDIDRTAIVSTDNYRIYSVRWRVFEGVDANGLMVVPNEVKFCSVCIPDAGQMPEELCGINESTSRLAIELARRGGLVIVPTVISRNLAIGPFVSDITDQEFLYRSAFVLGRHILGYQVQEALAAIDTLFVSFPDKPVMIAGWGEGGWIALHASAVDVRIDATLISGHFGPRENGWNEPIHRNLHGLLTSFGDAQLAAMIAPRHLVIDATPGPEVTVSGKKAAPGQLSGPTIEEAKKEFDVAVQLIQPWGLDRSIEFVSNDASNQPNGPSVESIDRCVARLGVVKQKDAPKSPNASKVVWPVMPIRDQRHQQTLAKWDRYQQRILESVHLERNQYWSKLDTSTTDKFLETVEPYRNEFRDAIIGRWEIEKKPANPRARLVYDEEDWLGYDVVLDVFDDVIAYGVLLVPKSKEPIQNRPCVVFQHGLEGRPTDTIVGDHPAYHDVSVQLVKQGYVVFAPQNLYLFHDRFRTLQRKSNLLGKTLFSTIIAQHQQIVHWLASRPEVNKDKIAFYGLSYGGKSAMRIPALVPEYCLSICSADFNDWVWKNASTKSPYSYIWTYEYEIFEFDLGRKFNYAEMATLIAPRPFMVERGHFDTVAPDERVGLEFAKVRNMYEARLGIGDRCEIEWFNGPHTIHGVGTFEFLKTHLR